MKSYTPEGLYMPRIKIALASSFEGILNDGAPECGLTSYNALHQLEEWKGRIFEDIVEPQYFSKIRNSRHMEAFLKLRPLVEVAEDYLTVIEMIEEYPKLIDNMMESPEEESSYDPLIEIFDDFAAGFKGLKKSAKQEYKDKGVEMGDDDYVAWLETRLQSQSVIDEMRRQRFKKAFYDERKRMQKNDYMAWMSVQSPFPETIEELRQIVKTQQRDISWRHVRKVMDKLGVKRYNEGEIIRGFIPWFATSKDEESTFSICEIYGNMGRFTEEDLSGAGSCIISRGRIIGKERTTDKVEQLKHIAEIEDIPRTQVWRLNDRYDKGQQIELRDNGFPYQFLLCGGGYAFPHDVRKAQEDPMVIPIPRIGFAKVLTNYADEWNC